MQNEILEVRTYLRKKGIRPDLFGYMLIIHAILTAKEQVLNGVWNIKITEIYKTVADKFGISYYQTERNIKTAIRATEKIPDYTTPGQFIIDAAERLVYRIA